MLEFQKLYQGFRDPIVIERLTQQIQKQARSIDRKIHIMEVCGGHTHTIMKYGLNQLLPKNISFIHGPGCPVCIMPKERIDQAITLATLHNVILVTLGDMIRVPGSNGTLAEYRSRGCDIRAIYDPLDTIQIAKSNPSQTVIFFAIGFETSTPMTAMLIELAEAQNIDNILFHINHVLVPPAIEEIMNDNKVPIDAFIGPSHVSVISGSKVYRSIVKQYSLPVVVSGFEPVDVMESILRIISQLNSGVANLENQYNRIVTEDGNLKAQSVINKYFTIRPVFRWRGLGLINNSALMLKPQYRHRDAESVYSDHLPIKAVEDHKACQCGDILRGISKPQDCKVFAKNCTPQTPLGSCMVSSEGACNAHYRYQGILKCNKTRKNRK